MNLNTHGVDHNKFIGNVRDEAKISFDVGNIAFARNIVIDDEIIERGQNRAINRIEVTATTVVSGIHHLAKLWSGGARQCITPQGS